MCSSSSDYDVKDLSPSSIFEKVLSRKVCQLRQNLILGEAAVNFFQTFSTTARPFSDRFDPNFADTCAAVGVPMTSKIQALALYLKKL